MARSDPFTAAEVARYYAAYAPEIRQHGPEWRGPCPIHKGTHDSFAVAPETGLWTCHSQCGRGGSILDLEMALSGVDLKQALAEVNQFVGRSNGACSKQRRMIATYDYTDESGQLLFQCLRYEPKGFSQRRPDGRGGSIPNLSGVRRVLYRLPNLASACTILVAEGERDVHTLESLGFVATCNPMGAGKWRPEYAEALRGKEVVVFPDNDEPGRKHADQIVRSLAGIASSVRVVTVAIGKDVSDWVAEGATRDVIEAAIRGSEKRPFGAERKKQERPDDPPDSEAGLQYVGQPYLAHQGSLYVWKNAREGHKVPVKVANFVARIIADHVADDGAEQSRMFTVQAELAGRTVTADIPAKDFKAMNWIADKLGGMAIVLPGQSEHTRAAIQTLSGNIPQRSSYSHTGWRRIDGENYYLHCGGAIGRGGNRDDICVSLEDKLPNYQFPSLPNGNAQIAAIRASLRMLDVTLDRLTFPVYAAVWRSILGAATFSVHIAGSSGAGKSQLAALAQQHFGAAMDGDNLPASWLGTANATGTLAFYAKNAILVVDDFVPAGNAASQQKLHSEADKLLRAQGNSAGRRRLSSDGRLLGNRPPRGLILSTGEDTPRGKSLNARMVLLHFPRGAMDWAALSTCQELAATGEFASATVAYIQWLAPRLQAVQEKMSSQRFAKRREAEPDAVHMRTPENLYGLEFGLATFLEFAESVAAITSDEAKALARRGEKAFREAVAGEERKHADNEPSRVFLRLVRAAIAMGKAHLASPKGTAPDGERSWGWYAPAGTAEKQGRGAKIGWVKGEEMLLLPEAAHSVAARLGQEQGEPLPGSLDIIKRDLKEQRLLLKTDERRRTITIRRTVENEQQDVLLLTYDSFQRACGGGADNADIADNADTEADGEYIEAES
jgi:5S rRNA maturation endonuclease (ribonuclease M5)